jgi:uncharacterized membrane protein
LATLYNGAYAPIYREFFVTVVVDNDHRYSMIMAVFLFHHGPIMVVRGGFPPVPVSIMVVGVVILSHVVNLYRVSGPTIIFYGEGVAPALWLLQVSFTPRLLF